LRQIASLGFPQLFYFIYNSPILLSLLLCFFSLVCLQSKFQQHNHHALFFTFLNESMTLLLFFVPSSYYRNHTNTTHPTTKNNNCVFLLFQLLKQTYKMTTFLCLSTKSSLAGSTMFIIFTFGVVPSLASSSTYNATSSSHPRWTLSRMG